MFQIGEQVRCLFNEHSDLVKDRFYMIEKIDGFRVWLIGCPAQFYDSGRFEAIKANDA